MKTTQALVGSRNRRILATAALSVLLSACTTGGSMFDVASPSFNGTSGTTTGPVVLDAIEESDLATIDEAPPPSVIEEGDTVLPTEVAYLPADKPGTGAPMPGEESAEALAATPNGQDRAVETGDESGGATAAATLQPAPAPPAEPPKKRGFFASLFNSPAPRTAETERGRAPRQNRIATPETTVAAAIPADKPETATPPLPAPANAAEETAASTDDATQPVAPEPTAFIESGPGPAPAPVQKRGFLASLFSNDVRSADTAERPAARTTPRREPVVALASTGPAKPIIDPVSPTGSGDALPGVRQSALFEITRKSGLDEDDDIDVHEAGEPVRVASAAGLARLAPNGLIKQTDRVDVGCLKPSLVRVLRRVEQHFGKKLIVTSGYRSPARNRRARGARNSLHMYCAAADVQVPGVSKAQLARFVRAMPGRGGVGTYCHTKSVHIDVGPERDWNWRCRRRR